MDKRALQEAIVSPTDSLRDVMCAIDRNGLEVALVCERSGKIFEVVTDGDIRRALIRGEELDDPIQWKGELDFARLPPSATRADAIRLMLRNRIKAVPVVAEDGTLLDLHTLHSALASTTRDSWAVIMAGGKGERLGDLTHGIPKPMLPIGDRPLLEHIVQHLVSHGIRRIFLSVNYLATMIEDHFGTGSRFSCRIDYLRETEPLGTGGPLSLLPEAPTAPLVVMNGDLLTRINVTRMLDFHKAHACAATMALRSHVVRVPFGVATQDQHRVVSLTEKPALEYQINAGVYVLDPGLLKHVPQGPYPITGLIDHCLSHDLTVGAYPMQESWSDIGLPDEYQAAMRDETA